jgi:starch phosphorylase
MKAAANGALNMSILDGWWAEGYQPEVGWAIGSGEEYEDLGYQDDVESQSIYNLLEKSVIPLFYERGRDNLPRDWIDMMKRSMQLLASRFNSHRMLQDYVHRLYVPLAQNWDQIQSNRFQGARDLKSWLQRVRVHWNELRVLEKKTNAQSGILLGDSVKVEVTLDPGSLAPEDLSVELYYGPVDSKADFLDRNTLPIRHFRREGDRVTFCGDIPCQQVGRFGFRIRILPFHRLLTNPLSTGLILWG